jgi:type II secretory pathway pseudopilin PulG
MKNFSEILKARQEAKGESGFSLLEMVVAMGILIVLTVGGILAYNGITDNARQAAVDTAAKGVYTAAVAYESDNDGGTDRDTAVTEYNDSADGAIEVAVTNAAPGELGITATNPETLHTSTVGAATVAP